MIAFKVMVWAGLGLIGIGTTNSANGLRGRSINLGGGFLSSVSVDGPLVVTGSSSESSGSKSCQMLLFGTFFSFKSVLVGSSGSGEELKRIGMFKNLVKRKESKLMFCL